MAQVDKIPEYAKTAPRNFLSPIDELDLKDAVEAKKKSITIKGKDFKIEYHGERIWLQVKKGYAPCGWYEIKRIGDFDE